MTMAMEQINGGARQHKTFLDKLRQKFNKFMAARHATMTPSLFSLFDKLTTEKRFFFLIYHLIYGLDSTESLILSLVSKQAYLLKFILSCLALRNMSFLWLLNLKGVNTMETKTLEREEEEGKKLKPDPT